MGDVHTRDLVDPVWKHQSVWSQTANLLERAPDLSYPARPYSSIAATWRLRKSATESG
jgi:hypothetical protein